MSDSQARAAEPCTPDEMCSLLSKVVAERDAARADLAEMTREARLRDEQVGKARSELAEVKAARDDDLEELVARFNLIQQAEAREAALREGVRALADEWRTAHGDPPVDPSHISVRHAERLLALIGDQP